MKFLQTFRKRLVARPSRAQLLAQIEGLHEHLSIQQDQLLKQRERIDELQKEVDNAYYDEY